MTLIILKDVGSWSFSTECKYRVFLLKVFNLKLAIVYGRMNESTPGY